MDYNSRWWIDFLLDFNSEFMREYSSLSWKTEGVTHSITRRVFGLFSADIAIPSPSTILVAITFVGGHRFRSFIYKDIGLSVVSFM